MKNLDARHATAPGLPTQRRTQHDDLAVTKAISALRMVEAGEMTLAAVWPWVMLELGVILDRAAA